MCGLAGLLAPADRIADPAMAMVVMSEAIRHRGPDGDGSSFDPRTRLAMVHRRLAIQDPSDDGAQPMASADGRFEIVYNGEIYDFPERRAELEATGRRFRTGTDTEVLLAGFEHWGIEATLDRIDGMFAFAVHDRERRELVLARDRAGQKPLLFAEVSGVVAFASDLRALERLPEPFASRLDGIDETSLEWFLRLGAVPWPRSIRPGVEQVPPGGLVRVDTATASVRRGRWWTPPVPEPLRDADSLGRRESGSTMDVVRESVHRRCRADREVGVFLSGGLDSRLVAALATEVRPGLPCFTLQMPGPFDETPDARDIAERIGCPHHVISPTPEQILDTVLALPRIGDEPFADSSLVATNLLARAARETIVVALGGDGGDELFGGYRRHAAMRRRGAWNSFERAMAGMIERLPGALTGRIPVGRGSLAEAARRRRSIDPRGTSHVALRETQGDAGACLGPRPGDPDAFRRARALENRAAGAAPWDGVGDLMTEVRSLMAADFRTYLPDDPLVKIDRGTMNVALEHRAPLLGREVIHHACSLPTETLFDERGGRAPLRGALRELGLPDTGRKRGFAVPIFEWLRGPLREHAASLLIEPCEDPLSPNGVRDLFEQVQGGRRDLATACWTVYCWRAWLHERRSTR
ncbi:MAG: asparagine synthase (glutamine-hydrolyzing) [Phycisphaerae bacterium]|nr:asparagine synthase (glutamine-hydrolyzing) [Phycisphaerae bacterium]